MTTRYIGPQQTLPPLGDWADRSACREVETSVFYPQPVTKAGREYDAARVICSSCPVLEPCRAYGLEHNPPGMWGGLSEWDRRRLTQRDRRRRPAEDRALTPPGLATRCPGCRRATPGIWVAGGRQRECPYCRVRWSV